MSVYQLICQFLVGVVACLMISPVYAQLNITHIESSYIADQGTEIRIIFNGLPAQPTAYQLKKPNRIVLDFDQVQSNLAQKKMAIASQEATSMALVSDTQRSRLLVDLARAGVFTTRIEGNSFILKIYPPNATPTGEMPSITPLNPQRQGLEAFTFQPGPNGEGQLVLTLLDRHTPVDIQQQNNQVKIKLLGHHIPKHAIGHLNVSHLATAVTEVDAYNSGLNGVIRVKMKGDHKYTAYQAEQVLTLNFQRPAKQAGSKYSDTPVYTGKKISLDFQDIDIRRILQLLAEFTNINIVAADSISGSISLRLKDVPWDQALDIILAAKNLQKRQNGNVILIAPVTEFAKSDAERAKMLAEQVKLAPIHTEYIQLNYAKAEDIKKLISARQSANQSTPSPHPTLEQQESLLSYRGGIAVDTRTNTLIVHDTAPFISKIRNMVALLDIPVKQVMVEARLVTADTHFSRELGIKWGIQRNTAMIADQPRSSTERNNSSPSFDLAVNLATKAAGTLSFGLLNISDHMLNLQLSAMQADGFGEVLSAPKVLTADKQTAYILRGDQIPYQAWSQSTGIKTEFKNANLKLEVTPSITPNGQVQMALKIEKDTIGQLTEAGYTLKTNKLETNVLVHDGETVVLGGIFDDAKTTSDQKVPLLGDLPWIGPLFKQNKKTSMQSELLIFITPRIVNDTVSRNH